MALSKLFTWISKKSRLLLDILVHKKLSLRAIVAGTKNEAGEPRRQVSQEGR